MPASGAAAPSGAGQFSAVQVEYYNKQCQELKGPYWAFDGVDDCTCATGAHLVDNDCVPVGAAGGRAGGSAGGGGSQEEMMRMLQQMQAQQAQQQAQPAGPGGGAGGVAGRGGGAAAASGRQESLKDRNDKLCRDRFGPGAEFDGADGCRCQKGFTNVNGSCTRV